MPSKSRTAAIKGEVSEQFACLLTACGPCVINCYPSQPQFQPAYYQPVIFQTPVVIQPPAVVQPQLQSTQQCIGPCVNSQCPAGYTCNQFNVCCATVAGK
ncbi:hypothetical protein Aduo_016846 [Ancylostoma duodenale]